MPLYEYSCRDCGARFERVVFGSETADCPKCESARVVKLLSVFAVGSAGQTETRSEAPSSACGSCGDPRGPGACSIN